MLLSGGIGWQQRACVLQLRGCGLQLCVLCSVLQLPGCIARARPARHRALSKAVAAGVLVDSAQQVQSDGKAIVLLSYPCLCWASIGHYASLLGTGGVLYHT